MIDFIQIHWPELFFAAFMGYFLYQVYKNKGFKGAIFGAEKLEQLGEIEGRKTRGIKSVIRVHKMKDHSDGEEIVGLELVSKAFLSYAMTPYNLSKEQAKQLAELLLSASKDDT